MKYNEMPIFKMIRRAVMTSVAVVAIGLTVGFTSIASLAAECAGKITATTCNVRADASTTSASIGSKSKDETIKILGQKTGADGYVWYQIYINATTVGYVRSDLATITDGGTPDTIGADGTVTSIDSTVTACNPVSGTVSGGQAVRVRADASTSSTIVSSAASGTSLTVNGTKTGSDGREWYYVEYTSDGSNVKGFIRSDFITLSGTLTPLTTETDTPATTDPEPTTDTEPATEPVAENAEYALTQEGGAWVFYDYANNKKYALTDILDIVHKYENNELSAGKKGGAAKTVWLIIFIILTIGASAAAVYFFLKLREIGDKSAFADAEKERKARLANSAAKSGNAGTRPAGARPAGASAQRPAGAPAQRPAGARPAGAPAQRPAGAPAQRPAGARPAGATAPRPAGAPAQRPAGATAPRPAGAPAQRPVQSAPRPAETARPNPQPASRTSVDDDDEFEFGFLNWDGDDKK